MEQAAVGGFFVLTHTGADLWLVKLNANGDSLWANKIHRVTLFQNMKKTADNGLIITGTLAFLDKNNLYPFLIKTDSLGNFPPLPVFVNELGDKKSSYGIFPNPFSDNARLVFENRLNQKSRLQIFNLTGQMVREYAEITGNSCA